jgi:hypothetical protein
MAEAYKSVRLSLLAASREFGISRTAIKARLTKTEPGEDGCFSIKQISDAIHNDSKALKDQTEIERCRWYHLRNEMTEGRLVNRDVLLAGLEASYNAVLNVVKGSNLAKRDQDDILKALAQCPVVVQQVADKQSKDLIEAKRKKKEDADDDE